MSDNKQSGPGKIIRTSSGSTRLTAGSGKSETAASSGSSGSSGSGRSGSSGSSNSGRGGSAPRTGTSTKAEKSAAPATEKATVVAPPAPKASPKPGRAPSTGSAPTAPATSASTQTADSQSTASQTAGGTGSGPSTSVMGNVANTVRASSGGVKMGVKNMVDNGKGKKRKGPRTVRLTVAAVDPWSVMKMSFLMSVAIGIATIVAFVVLWIVLQATGVMSGLEATMTELAGAESAERIVGIFGFGRVVAAGFIIAVINIVLMTALSTLAAFVYNIGSLIAGGFHLTLTDD
ncbi:DUF3566 domain-containing protein [Brevibacterium casei]|uniref:DUF3566 domain-containing protein n=1 Tax=Brevibacterium casei TaxID=33889 RepID=UPI001E4AB567|nr:DUF3566 domain-containing protein [Brevibacterium casei]